MRYCVLGSGLMGKVVAYDLLQQNDTDLVFLTDNDEKKLHEAKIFLNNDSRLKTQNLDVSNEKQLVQIFGNVDAAIAAVSYKFNEYITKIAIKTKTHLCDLGGNNDVVNAQLGLHKHAEEAGISIIPDCGLAPGMVSVLVKHGLKKYDWADTVKIRVGGLPLNPKNELKYEKLFSVDGLINEYAEPVRVLKNGKIEVVEPLTEVEPIEFPVGIYCSKPLLEAFTTSGGVSTLVETYKERLVNLDYKTIRYQGHCEKLHELKKIGLFTKEYFERELPVCQDDVTLVKIIFEGAKNKHELVIIDRATTKPEITSMMRMTAFSASIIAQMQARQEINIYGVCPQEQCVPPDIFISELKKRNIVINSL